MNETEQFIRYIEETVLNRHKYAVDYTSLPYIVRVYWQYDSNIFVDVNYSNDFLNDLYKSLSARNQMLKKLNSMCISPANIQYTDHTEQIFRDLMPLLESIRSAKSADELKMMMAISGI